MKFPVKIYLKLLCIALLAIAVLYNGPAIANESGPSGGGSVAIEFERTARMVVKILREKNDLSEEIDVDAFEAAINNANILEKDEIIYNDVPYPAIKVPNKDCNGGTITLSRSMWPFLSDLEKKENAFHEVLGLMCLERDNYPHSSQLFNWTETDLFFLYFLGTVLR